MAATTSQHHYTRADKSDNEARSEPNGYGDTHTHTNESNGHALHDVDRGV